MCVNGIWKGAIVALALFTIACNETTAPGAPTESRIAPLFNVSKGAPEEIVTSDDEWARIAREEIPGYAGHYKDKSGAVIVALADTTNTASKMSKFEQHFGQLRGARRTKKVDYDFNYLHQLHDSLESNLRVATLKGNATAKSVTTVDIDEVRNRLVIGVWPQAGVGAMRQWLSTVGIPERAVIVDAQQGYRLFYNCTVSDMQIDHCQRPLVNGVGVLNYYGEQCTLGVNAYVYPPMFGTPYEGFVTAAHCSIYPGQPGVNDVFSQGLVSGYQIGIAQKSLDYAFQSYRLCQYPCRFSDAIVVQYGFSPTWYQRGWYPQMNYINYNTVDTTLARQIANRVFWNVQSAELSNHYLIYGAVVEKIASNTGHTTGAIVQTCQDYAVQLPNNGPVVSFRCQYEVEPTCITCDPVMSDEGDSGAGMFMRSNASSPFSIAGILSGGILRGSDNHINTIFSPWYAVVQELVGGRTGGSLTVTP